MESSKKIERLRVGRGVYRIELTLRWLLGGLFIFAGAIKAFDPTEFANDIANYQLLPWQYAVAAAHFLPWLELIAGAALITGKWLPGALRILLLLMLLFIQALVTAWLRGLNIHCGCFGRAFATSNYALLFLRDFTITFALGWLFLRDWQRRIAEEPPED